MEEQTEEPFGRTFTRARDPDVFPPGVAQHTVSYDDETVTCADHPWIALPPWFTGAVAKRRAEFLAGRWCARQALRVRAPTSSEARNAPVLLARAPDAFDPPVGIGEHREPLWPTAVLGSISHSSGYASAAIVRAADARGIGLDVESIMSDKRAENVASAVATPGEIAAVERLTGWPRAVALTVIFSAKECVFKCLYPEVQRYFGFHDAEIVGVDAGRRSFAARLLVALTEALPAGFELAGRFELRETSLWTGIFLERT